MDPINLTATWIWHPDWTETPDNSAGKFVHFRKEFIVSSYIPKSLNVLISADTKYKLFVNSQLVSVGPVKGDQHLWFYDEVDIAPFIKIGQNVIAVRVLRFYYATGYAVSFPRLTQAGLFIKHTGPENSLLYDIETDASWETAIDNCTNLLTDQAEDDFLHIYEDVTNNSQPDLEWCSARVLKFPTTHGLTPPWKLAPRMIPLPQHQTAQVKVIHNVRSSIPVVDFKTTILREGNENISLTFPAGSKHHIELEMDQHVTAYIAFRFQRPQSGGSILAVTYSECYEEEPEQIPYLRKKGDRCDTGKMLLGPKDKYCFRGVSGAKSATELAYDYSSVGDEVFAPFHFRTFRFITLDLEVCQEADLVLGGIDIFTTNYPLDVRANISVSEKADDAEFYQQLWSTSVRTLRNCLHDCYEDCPFYEQLQYAMDTRSSILFTYCIASDDRLARQAILQLHNSYQPSVGLTASRAPSHQMQVIPHFSLFWICAIRDHYDYFGDEVFISQFLSTVDAILGTFARLISPETGLIRHNPSSPHWDFVDWTDTWRPFGIPPAAARTGYLSFTNMLYAYVLIQAAELWEGAGRTGMAEEYETRAAAVVQAVRKHCFDGELFTDGLASNPDGTQDYSQTTQIWAVLSGAAIGATAASILRRSLTSSTQTFTNGDHQQAPSLSFAPASTAMSFYALRALSRVGGTLYDDNFHSFWTPWRTQLANNMTTWEEDSVSQRSDCHAWGSAPLYEFPAEVAGIRPGGPGWSTIVVQPRLRLYKEFSAKVPFGARGEARIGVAHVKWSPEGSSGEDGRTKVQLKLTFEMDRDKLATRADDKASLAALPPVEVRLPGKDAEIIRGKLEIVRTVEI